MADIVNWGILGAAKFAREHMGPAIHAARGGRLAALATSSRDKAAGFTAFAPDCRIHDSYDALLADPGIDAIYIPLPNHLHVDWAKRAAEAGKHVLCEKPVAMRAEEIDDLVATRDRTGRLVAEAYMIVHHPQWQTTRDLLRDGAIGTLMRVDANFSYHNTDPANIRNRAEAGGGALRDIGVYIFGATRFATGEEPQAILSHAITWEDGVDATAHLTARFASFHYTGMVSMRMAPFQEVTFHGTQGWLKLTAPFNAQVYDLAEITLRHARDGIRVWRFPSDNHYMRQVEAFNASVTQGAAYPCPLEFVRGTQAMIDRVFDAAGQV